LISLTTLLELLKDFPKIWPKIRDTWTDSEPELACLADEAGMRNSGYRSAGHFSRCRINAPWCCSQWKLLRPPLLTCEPVLTEAAFLLKREGRDPDLIFALLERGVIQIALHVEEMLPDLRALMLRYRNRPMSLADACLVRLSELHPKSEIFTLDWDFRLYRRNGNKVIPVLMPD
jgi:predicted nucleic acid-binding protein